MSRWRRGAGYFLPIKASFRRLGEREMRSVH